MEILNGRLARWSLKLQGFAFDIQHQKGTQHFVPDMLSRFDMEELNLSNHLTVGDLNSEKYKNLLQSVKENIERLHDIKILDEYVYKRTNFYDGDPVKEDHSWKLWIPEELTKNSKICAYIRSHDTWRHS